MFGLQRIIAFTTLITSAIVLAAPHHNDDSLVDWGRLSEILDTIDNNILHSVLHNLSPKFRDGVFSKDRAAIEHVHSSNPIVASKLVYLAKRQSNTTTTQSVASVAPAVSSAVSSQLTQSTVPPPTTILVPPTAPSDATAIATITGAVVYSTIGGGVVTETSSAISVSFTKSTSTHIFTVTGGNGQLTTSTSLIIVNAPVTGIATGAAAGATTSTNPPGLQNHAPPSNAVSIFGALLAGTLSFFIAL